MSEERTTTYKGVRIDDAAEWRLAAYISETGMSAWLRNLENPLDPIVTMFEQKWESDETGLLRHIENAVYDHPQLLDEFSTDIVVCCRRTIWAPEKLSADYDEQATIYTSVYTADEEDILSDSCEGMNCIYSFTAGLPGFLRRTLPGARVLCHQSALVKRALRRAADMPTIFVDIRDDEADFTAVDGRNLLLCATHRYRRPEDIAYHVFNIMDIFGMKPHETQVSLSGRKDVKQFLLKNLREHIAYVMLTMLPTSVSKTEMPLSAALCLARGTES